MQNPQGRVVSAHSRSVDDQGRAIFASAIVAVDAGVICARCESGKGCGAGLLGANAAKQVNVRVAANIDVKEGDVVRISLQPSNILRAAVVVYGFPLVGAVLGAVGAYGFGLGDAAAALAALSGIAAGFLLAKSRLRDERCLREFTPVVLEKLPSSTAAD